MSDFDCNYALEILMRRLTNELVMHVDLTTAKSPPNQCYKKFAIYLLYPLIQMKIKLFYYLKNIVVFVVWSLFLLQ